MKITNETYMMCEKCGTEAHGIDDINRRFGYIVNGEEISPYPYCKECREQEDSAQERYIFRKQRTKNWASAAGWGRELNISRATFISYLQELGYIEQASFTGCRARYMVLTEKGREHSRLANSLFGTIILWDYNTFAQVAKCRVERAIVHECCPKCHAYLDTFSEYDHFDFSHKCENCGHLCEEWLIDVVYDR